MNKIGPFAEVIVALNTRRTDRVFHYAVPDEFQDQVTIGSRVIVPFGGRRLTGYVTGFGYPDSTVKVKEIAGVIDAEPVFTTELLELARWMAENYICSTAEALQRIISPRFLVKGSREVKRVYSALPKDKSTEELSSIAGNSKQSAALKRALACPGLTRKELAAAAEVSTSVVNALIKKGLLTVSAMKISRHAVQVDLDNVETKKLTLNADQENALAQAAGAIRRGAFKTFLLHGVTGSGKTEVYLQAIAVALEEGRQAVTLVPEIALTPQMIELFRARFGAQVAVLHSALPGGERYDEWQRIKEGGAPVVLGTRSAVFAPLTRPGLFVIDEEHESSYKQDDHLRYHAREIALKRAQLAGATVLLGSATPSLESRIKTAVGGPYQLLKLNDRVDGRPLPPVRVVDLRREVKEGNGGIFSRTLIASINRRLESQEQVLLFLNRRGFSTFVICRECGLVLKCPRCDISLTYHRDGRLRCHYCNHQVRSPELCPKCGAHNIRLFGAGTQKVEAEAVQFFPGARILRMDSDSTARKGSHTQIINAFQKRQADILIGTQMIAKGLDFPGVTLVGVINADTALHMPDFRAAERTFQLLTQVAGRAGRGSLPGEVLIQTYNPEHYSIVAAAAHDCDRFFLSEMPVRRSLGYPPFSHLARLLFTHEDEEVVKRSAALAKDTLKKILSSEAQGISILGPAPAALSKIKDRYRWQLVLKASRRNLLRDVIKEFLSGLERERAVFKLAVNVDINPQGML
ncbi:MAG: Primosomal protein N' [Pelotomaculum sp. PtaB.Bin104]|nr:MAG: Primosomal protein N' [Pelotomaculum sp. PtaB.Bin104]